MNVAWRRLSVLLSASEARRQLDEIHYDLLVWCHAGDLLLSHVTQCNIGMASITERLQAERQLYRQQLKACAGPLQQLVSVHLPAFLNPSSIPGAAAAAAAGAAGTAAAAA